MSKYKVPTTKISCRVETDKLQKLLDDSGLSVSQLIDKLIDEKVSDSFVERKVNFSFVRVEKGKIEHGILESCWGDQKIICDVLRDYCNIILKNINSGTLGVVAKANNKYIYDRCMKIYERISEQIGYDYDIAMEKCKKRLQDNNIISDVGEDALVLAVKHKKNRL